MICRDKHLLSLRDLNTLDILPRMIEAGISSFKIEGRLKEAAYVKNTVASYRNALDKFIAENPDKYCRSSFGSSDISFTPELSKSFNRGFSHYFIVNRRPKGIISPDTPKSMGETIKDVKLLNNGDGISFFDADGQYSGAMVNGIQGNRIITSRPVNIPKGAVIHRTFDRVWDKELQRDTAIRKIGVEFCLDEAGLTATDERGCMIRIPLECKRDIARKTPDFSPIFAKLGNTPYRLQGFESRLDPSVFIPAADLTEMRRKAVEALDIANKTSYHYLYRKKESMEAKYMTASLDYRDNVANSLAKRFYCEHGVKKIERAMEVSNTSSSSPRRLMTTRHCILREIGLCKKEKGLGRYAEPLSLKSGRDSFTLEFNCRDCEMHLLG